MRDEDVGSGILNALGEHADQPRAQLAAIIGALGAQAALSLLDETLDIEADGGMLVADGSRRRSPGGVFFYLARKKLSPEQRRAIFDELPEALRRAAPERARDAARDDGEARAARVGTNGGACASGEIVAARAERAAPSTAIMSWQTPTQPRVQLHEVGPAHALASPVKPHPTATANLVLVDRRSLRNGAGPAVDPAIAERPTEVPAPETTSTSERAPTRADSKREPRRRSRGEMRTAASERETPPELDADRSRAGWRGVTTNDASPQAPIAARAAMLLNSASFEDEVQALVDAFVADLVPLLRQNMVEKVRGALEGSSRPLRRAPMPRSSREPGRNAAVGARRPRARGCSASSVAGPASRSTISPSSSTATTAARRAGGTELALWHGGWRATGGCGA